MNAGRVTPGFPTVRLRRLRGRPALRALVRETPLNPGRWIYPLFLVPGSGIRREIPSLPGQYHWSADRVAEEVRDACADGIGAFLLFGQAESAAKDDRGSPAWDPEGAVQQGLRLLRREFPDIVLISDVCLCAYTAHGHCGVLRPGGTAQVDNDATLPLLARVACSHADAGADIVAPSDMMDGRVGAIRTALDQAGRQETGILAYAAKFASGFYGPFRDAEGSAPQAGDRRGYQLDPANARQALAEVRLDLAEAADMVMVKPALAYLDVITRVRAETVAPLVAYNVSGEYAMVRAAAAAGWADGATLALEVLTAIHRAGADAVITYHAREAAQALLRGRSL